MELCMRCGKVAPEQVGLVLCANCDRALTREIDEQEKDARIARLQAEVTATRWRDEVCRCHRGGCAGCDKRISDARAAVDQHKDLEV